VNIIFQRFYNIKKSATGVVLEKYFFLVKCAKIFKTILDNSDAPSSIKLIVPLTKRNLISINSSKFLAVIKHCSRSYDQIMI